MDILKIKKKANILFAGDVNFGEYYQAKIVRRGGSNILEKGYGYPLKKLKNILKSSDRVFANLEGVLTDLRTSEFTDKKKCLLWSDSEKAAEALFLHNIRIVSLANNHAIDFGPAGLIQTFNALKKHTIQYYGAGNDIKEASKPYILKITDGQFDYYVATICAFENRKKYQTVYRTYASKNECGVRKLDVKQIADQVQFLRKTYPNIFIVLFPHWGGEDNYRWKIPSQTKLAKSCFNAGVDLIIGHGAHMFQEIEVINHRWVINSLGNFMFNSKGKFTRSKKPPFGLIAKLIIRLKAGKPKLKLVLYPIFINNLMTNFQSRPVTDEEFKVFYTLLNKRCPESLSRMRTGQDEFGFFLQISLTHPIHHLSGSEVSIING